MGISSEGRWARSAPDIFPNIRNKCTEVENLLRYSDVSFSFQELEAVRKSVLVTIEAYYPSSKTFNYTCPELSSINCAC